MTALTMECNNHVVSVLMPVSRWQKSLLVLMLLTLCSAQSTYYVTPTPDTPCPGEPCHTLSQYVADQYFKNFPVNTAMEFLPGNHTLEQTISVTNLMSISLYGGSSSLPEVTSRIVCTWPAGFVFTDITELHISSLAFISCGHNNSAAVSIILVQQSSIFNCSFHNNVNADGFGGALYIKNSDVILASNKFQHNHAEYGGALCMLTSKSSIAGNTFEYNFAEFCGGALYVANSTLALTRNTFQYNSAAINFGGALIIHSSTFTLTKNTFQNNSATEFGGALFVYSSSLTLTRNTFQNNSATESGGALFVYSSSLTLTRNTFQNNSATTFGGALEVHLSTLNLTRNIFQSNYVYAGGAALHVSSSTLDLTRNRFQNNFAAKVGGALFVNTSTITLTRNTFQNNSAAKVGGVLSVDDSTLTLTRNTFQYNFAAIVGGALSVNNSTLTLTRNTFQNNYATALGGAIFVQLGMLYFTERNTIGKNIAQYGGGISAIGSKLELAGDTSFDRNIAFNGGGLFIYHTTIGGNMTFNFNLATEGGGAVYALQSTFNFMGESTIEDNVAADGGGLLLLGESTFYLQSNAHLYFINNNAKYTGGAIKVEESRPFTHCIYFLNYVEKTTCFFQITAPTKPEQCEQYINDLNISIIFSNNSAVQAGADLHGGSVDNCKLFEDYSAVCPDSGEVFDHIISSDKADVSSDPLSICTCRDNWTDCSSSYHHPKPVYPGGTLEIPVIARGQRNGTTAAVIQHISTYNSSIVFEKRENIQYADNKCTALTYTIHSYKESITQHMTLYAKGPCPPTDTSSNTLKVLIDISPCPPGFQISKIKPKCICAERLQRFTTMCLVDYKEILRAQDSRFWVGYDIISQGLILHPHCPFDYCTVKELHLAVDDSDKQCNYNRSGLLCGTCSESLSLALGSSHCLQCSNSYLLLVFAFAFAGIALVILLLVLRLTVAAGTINGLIFYANVLAVNSANFLQPRTTNTLTVFIAWLNLDLGIEICFYGGMDAYVKTWLQFAFPLYVWALVGMIIIGSHYSGRVAKVFGSNPVAVLATLFLLSYAKLLRTVIAVLSYTYLEYSNNSQIAVWLYDGNIRYLSGKHIPLFIAAMACLVFLFFPYTMLLTFSQCLQTKSELKIFSCMNVNSRYVKPFLDAYHAPYSNKHRYWTGLMLLFRFILFLISAVNALGDPSVNLLAIASTTTLIPPTILGFRIHKTWSLCLLETSFIINLTILAVATLYIDRVTGGNQNAATFTSIGIAFATFTGIVIYHSIQQIKGTRLWRSVCLRHDDPLTDVVSGPEDPPDSVFVSRLAPTQTLVEICYHELREPCMATD